MAKCVRSLCMRLWSLIAILFFSLPGCTAIKASVQVTRAEAALGVARDEGADAKAVYEYTMALRYLEKAREEIGWTDYRMSDELSVRSMEWADKAIIAMDGGNTSFEILPDAVLRDRPVALPPVTDDNDDEGFFEPKESTVLPPAPEPEPEPEPEVVPDEWGDDLDEFELEE